VDDRFDRRELLLHLGDVLEAISCVAKAGKHAAPVTELAKTEESLQEFVFLKVLADAYCRRIRSAGSERILSVAEGAARGATESSGVGRDGPARPL